MGIDVHGLNFLRYCKMKKDFGRILTVGRQHIHIRNIEKIQKILQDGLLNIDLYFCEELLERYFGAKSISSIDASDREKPTFVHDLNESIPPTLEDQFDTLLDYGTSEHIFDVAQAFRNYSKIIEEGGQLIHVLPADNFNGHGLWQFSPEFFYSLYARHNGFEDTEVFIADLSDERYWYKVPQPTNGGRVMFSTVNPTYILVRTV
jgi:hypothetical protein